MSERRALILSFAAIVLLVPGVVAMLMLMRVNETLIAAVFMMLAALGAHALSRVVMHYESPEERRR
jgi:multisubunit Na+/H+ antiporter MnhG subunit